ncbi:MAG: carboxypeptidase-like regulatory domain-containing protein, partial [Candidatus Poribacteria bacterium]|nr:carboxypeptidase-like regulatory domain-containing protein [Candidatus Poribacteria bacterium]
MRYLAPLALTILSLMLPFKGLAQDKSQSVLTGVIRDQTTQQTVAEATVSVAGQPRQNTVSNQHGEFSLPLPVGNYSLQVSHPGYETVVKTDIIATRGRRR